MQEDIEYSKDDEIKNIKVGRPHVVLLGAGASKAAFPKGDKRGVKLPLMNDLVDSLDLSIDFKKHKINVSGNFEDAFSDLYEKDQKHPLIDVVENKIFDFFSKLELPDNPTIYDYLVLSLRDKDVIATFNWDPFLWMAAKRNHRVVNLPHLIFLHGNVAVGYCHNCKLKGENNYICQKCGKPYIPSKLLYPIKQKDYNSDPAISVEWLMMKKYIKHAYVFTVFGYSVPKTDVEAIEILKEAWGGSENRNFEQIEFIYKPGSKEDKVIKPWEDFIHTHHYQTTDDFFKSFIANHPRRTCDAMWAEKMEARFIDDNPAPRNISLLELQNWFRKFREYENG